MDETYHSRHGALQESLHVFIGNGLLHYCGISEGPLNILEVGMGTGLNVFLTADTAIKINRKIEMTTLEPFPLENHLLENLNYGTILEDRDHLFEKIHSCPWNIQVPVTPVFTLEKVNATLHDFRPFREFDLIYYDAFAPSKQPELWEPVTLGKVTGLLKPGGILVTYCAQGRFKKLLQSFGCKVETLPGPPGKKEMVRATRPE